MPQRHVPTPDLLRLTGSDGGGRQNHVCVWTIHGAGASERVGYRCQAQAQTARARCKVSMRPGLLSLVLHDYSNKRQRQQEHGSNKRTQLSESLASDDERFRLYSESVWSRHISDTDRHLYTFWTVPIL